MKDINKIILLGRLGADPILRKTKRGTSVGQISLATSRKTMNESGEEGEETQWHRVVVWGNLADYACDKLKKGHVLYVEGQLRTRNYQSKEGEEKLSVEVNAEQLSFLGRRALVEEKSAA